MTVARSLVGQAVGVLKGAKSLSVLTGAGVSKESGIPTFRDADGIWKDMDPLKVATLEGFMKDPKFVWEWYIARMNKFKEAKPNPAHKGIAFLEGKIPQFTLITQNIDNLHHDAGSRHVIELHGNIWRTRCLKCHEVERMESIPQKSPPQCQKCQGMLRPDVVWFGEALDPDHVRRAGEACDVDAFLIVGTSGQVWPAAGFAHEAKRHRAYLVEINTQESELSSIVDLSLLGRAGEVFEQILAGW